VGVEGEFGICRGIGWCGWVLGGLRWPSGGFSCNQTSKRSLQENLQEASEDLQAVYKRMSRAVLEVWKVGNKVERVAKG